MISSLVTEFTAYPAVETSAIILKWTLGELPDLFSNLYFGQAVPRIQKEFSGRAKLVKGSLGYIANPDATDGVVLFDGTITKEETTYYFVDQGGASADYSGLAPVTELTSWETLGTGVAGGKTYYYSLFLYNTDGTYCYAPDKMLSKAYAYSNWGHALWFKNRLPRHYWKFDTNGYLARFVNVIGLFFDIVKTDIDRMEELLDPLRLDVDLLEFLEGLVGWPSETTTDFYTRRNQLFMVPEWYGKRGRLDNFLEAVSYTCGENPEIVEDFSKMMYMNGSFGPTFIPVRTESVLFTVDGAETVVSKLYLPTGTSWPEYDDFYNGHQVLVNSTLPQVAGIADYDSTDMYIITDKLLDFSENYDSTGSLSVKIMIGGPPLGSEFCPTDYAEKWIKDEVAKALLPGECHFQSLSIKISPDDETITGKMVDKIHLLSKILLQGTRTISCNIILSPVIEE